MPEYGSFCPVAIASDVLADRWTPLIVRELVLGNTRFNDIARGLPGISRSLLVQRLKHLERKGVIETWPLPQRARQRVPPHARRQGSRAGADRARTLGGGVDVLRSRLRATSTPTTLMWWLHRRVDREQLPHDRVVIQFDHTAPERRSYWIVLEQGEASVCLQHPGYDVDVVVTCTTPTLARVFSGVDTWNDSVRSGAIRVTGPRHLVSALPRWFLWSPWADDMRAYGEMLGAR